MNEKGIKKKSKELLENYRFKKLLILSRHGLRSPFEGLGKLVRKERKEEVFLFTEHEENPERLTEKGTVLEVYFGQYIRKYAILNNLMDKDGGNSGKDTRYSIYMNGYQRTVATGQSIGLGMFPGMASVVPHFSLYGEMDPVFDHRIKKDYGMFRNLFLSSKKLRKLDDSARQNYNFIKDIIVYGEGGVKKEDYYGEMVTLAYDKGIEPIGLFAILIEMSDNVLLQYYEGVDIERILDGRIRTYEDFERIVRLREDYMDFRYGDVEAGKYIAYPTLKYIYEKFLKMDCDGSSATDISVMVGHDCNIYSLLASLGNKDFSLESQTENTPVGGKVFFELWEDRVSGDKKIRLKYVYQSTEQIRNMERLTEENPPKEKIIQIPLLERDSHGMYSYEEFKRKVKSIIATVRT